MTVVGLAQIAGILEQAIEEGAHLGPKILDDLKRVGRLGPFIDGEMELLIPFQIAGGVVLFDVAVDLDDGAFQACEIAVAKIGGGELGRQPLEQTADPAQFDELVEREDGHRDRAVALQLERVLGDKSLQGLTDRRGGNAVIMGQLADRQHFARLELSRHQPLLDGRVGAVVERLMFDLGHDPHFRRDPRWPGPGLYVGTQNRPKSAIRAEIALHGWYII